MAVPSLLASLALSIPSPPVNGISIGPVRLHIYGLMIALGVVAAVWMAQRKWDQIGGRPGVFTTLAIWGVPGGLVGARLYSLATSWKVDTGGSVVQAFEIWHGGLGIWGGVALGVATGLYGAKRNGLPAGPLLDCVAPGLILAQAIGRWGNYFNQELYGLPTRLPWGLEISPAHRYAGYAQYATFNPTFLYESIWDFAGLFIILWIGRRWRWRRGFQFAIYVSVYTFGRFFTEYLRIDTAHRFFGLRLNDWTSVILFTASTIVLLAFGRAKPEETNIVGASLALAGPKGIAALRPDAVPGAAAAEESSMAASPRPERTGDPVPPAIHPPGVDS